jgi:hypothetical protein
MKFWSEQSWDEMDARQVRLTIDSRDLRKGAVPTEEEQRDR